MEKRLSFKQREGDEPINLPLVNINKEIIFHIGIVIEAAIETCDDLDFDNLTSIYHNYFNEKVPQIVFNPKLSGDDNFILNFKTCIEVKFGSKNFRDFKDFFNFWEFFCYEYHFGISKHYGIEKRVNNVLERFNSRWRLINLQFVKIVNDEEIATITQTLNHELDPIRKHSREALALMKGEDASFSNSIKESISMVEAAMQHISGDPSKTLGELIKPYKHSEGSLIRKSELGFMSTLYGIASEVGGIRHATNPEMPETYTYDDALYLYVRCSAFVNWVLATYPKVA